MNSGAGNPGLTLALPITLGLIFLMMIFIFGAFVFLVKRKRHMFEKWDFRKTPRTKKERARSNLKVQTISNKSDNDQQQQQQQQQVQQVRLFQTKEVPTRVRCGLLQVGDVYYEQESVYQAGKLSREAVDLMSHWVESCGRDDGGQGTVCISVDGSNLRPKSEPIKVELQALSKHIYEGLKNRSSDVGEIEVKKKNASYEGIKRLTSTSTSTSISTDSTSDFSKNKRKTFVAMYPLTSSSRDELNLFANDVIYYLGEKKKGWLKGEKKESGEIGWFPRSHVREGMNQAPDTSMYVSDPTDDDDFDDGDGNGDDDNGDGDSSIFECVAKHEYEATYDGDLSLKMGEVVLVRETLENGWWRGDSGGKSGFFPGSYVEVCDHNSLVTRSCINLSEEEKKFNSSGKRNFPGIQFIQKLSTINLSTLKKVKPKRKMRRESVKVMGRMPAPLPDQASNTEISNCDRQITSISYQDESKTWSNLDLVSTQNSDPIYGNLPECSANNSTYEEYAAAKLKPSQKSPIPLKQKIVEAVEPSKTPSTTLNGKKQISLNFQRNSGTVTSPLSNGHSSTTSLLALESSPHDNQQSRLSLNFGEELKSRVNMRMKAGE